MCGIHDLICSSVYRAPRPAILFLKEIQHLEHIMNGLADSLVVFHFDAGCFFSSTLLTLQCGQPSLYF